MSDTDNGCHSSDRVKGATGDFEIVVGLEVHARITDSSKLFSGAARGFGADPIARPALSMPRCQGCCRCPGLCIACSGLRTPAGSYWLPFSPLLAFHRLIRRRISGGSGLAMNSLEAMLTGGRPNSLGRTLEVVDAVLADRRRLPQLFDCYRSADVTVRLRASNALKRIDIADNAALVPFIDRLIDEVGALDQPSAQWTFAQLCLRLTAALSAGQYGRATAQLKANLAGQDDWIVLTTTMETLANWSRRDPDLKAWLAPHLDRLARDRRKSVAGRARKLGGRVG
jgi:hypothetical protein